MYTGKSYLESLKRDGFHIKDDHDRMYWETNFATLNKLFKSNSVGIMFTGNTMTDSSKVYRTFTINSVDASFKSYNVAVPVDD